MAAALNWQIRFYRDKSIIAERWTDVTSLSHKRLAKEAQALGATKYTLRCNDTMQFQVYEIDHRRKRWYLSREIRNWQSERELVC